MRSLVEVEGFIDDGERELFARILNALPEPKEFFYNKTGLLGLCLPSTSRKIMMHMKTWLSRYAAHHSAGVVFGVYRGIITYFNYDYIRLDFFFRKDLRILPGTEEFKNDDNLSKSFSTGLARAVTKTMLSHAEISPLSETERRFIAVSIGLSVQIEPTPGEVETFITGATPADLKTIAQTQFTAAVRESHLYGDVWTYHGMVVDKALYARAVVYVLAKTDVVRTVATLEEWETEGIDLRTIFKAVGHGVTALLFYRLVMGLDTLQSAANFSAGLSWISALVDDPQLAMQSLAFVRTKKWAAARDIREKLALALQDKDFTGNISYLQRLADEEIYTEGDYAVCKAELTHLVDRLIDQGSVGLGATIIVDTFLPRGSGLAKTVLTAGLDTRVGDQGLVDFLTAQDDGLKNVFHYFDMTKTETDSDDGSTDLTAVAYCAEEIMNRFLRLEAIRRRLYRLTAEGRVYLVKKLLVDAGLVVKKEHRHKTLQDLLARAISGSHEQVGVKTAIDAIVRAAGDVPDWELLFFGISPILARHLLIPPREPVEFTRSREYQEKFGTALSGDGYFEIDRLVKKRLAGADADISPSHHNEPWRHERSFVKQAEVALAAWLVSQGIAASARAETQSPIDFIADFAQRSGALFVRFLQLLEQFYPVPPELSGRFDHLYDQMTGQSKLAAIMTSTHSIPEMWVKTAKFAERVGGGSLMTVYRVEMADGSVRARRGIQCR